MQTKKNDMTLGEIWGVGGRNRGNLKDNINEHEKSKNKNIRGLCRGVTEFEKGHTSVELTG